MSDSKLKPKWSRKGIKSGRPGLPPEVRQYFVDHYLAAETGAQFLQGLEQATGYVMPWRKAKDWACRWGLTQTGVRPGGWFENALAAEIVRRGGWITSDTIGRMIRKGQLRVTRSLGRLCVVHEDAWALIDRMTAPVCPFHEGHPLMTAREADRMIGYSPARDIPWISEIRRQGRVRGVKLGRTVWIYRADVLAAVDYLRRTGETSVPWSKPEIWGQPK